MEGPAMKNILRIIPVIFLLSLPAVRARAQVVDFDGNVYDTIGIGSQVWFQENLKTTHYDNGIPIPNVTDMAAWGSLTTGARCYYNNDSSAYDSVYGVLYNWYAVHDANALCPPGWQVPTDAEWTALEIFLGGSGIAGGKMKETGTTHWLPPNAGATNSSGFTGLPGGMRDPSNTFGYLAENGLWWSSSSYGLLAWSRYLWYMNAGVDRNPTPKTLGLSIRCMKDVNVGLLDKDIPVKTRLYPNPSGGKITIDCTRDQNVSLVLYDISGVILMQKTLTGSTNEVDISSLAPGFYLIRLSGDNWMVRKKLIKE
jgi:uncharacterized protein (TIGR02145 family)